MLREIATRLAHNIDIESIKTPQVVVNTAAVGVSAVPEGVLGGLSWIQLITATYLIVQILKTIGVFELVKIIYRKLKK